MNDRTLWISDSSSKNTESKEIKNLFHMQLNPIIATLFIGHTCVLYVANSYHHNQPQYTIFLLYSAFFLYICL